MQANEIEHTLPTHFAEFVRENCWQSPFARFYSKIVSDMIVQAVLIWICHLFITKAGMIFVEVEVLRDGNEQLLNNLEEGLII